VRYQVITAASKKFRIVFWDSSEINAVYSDSLTEPINTKYNY
jgi:hypothetical protein